MQLKENRRGNYRFLTGGAAYSSGVVAMAGCEIVHGTFHRPLPYREGLARVDRHLAAEDRPRQALCGIELRSPRPVSLEGFGAFNQGYQQLLIEWDLLVDGANPITRTNVASEVHPPVEATLYAFSYTSPCSAPDAPMTFVVAGAGETRAGSLHMETVVRAGETSADAMCEKARCVMDTMAARLAGLGVGWADVTAADVYTVYDLRSDLAAAILERMGPNSIHGVHWHFARPPILGVEFEMDVRGVRREIRVG